MTMPSNALQRGTQAVTGWKRLVIAGSVSALILLVLAWKADARWEGAAEQLRRLNLPLCAGILAFSALWHMLLGADKWWRIMVAQGADVGFWEVFRVRLGSDPIRFAAPLKSGELINAVYFSRYRGLGFGRAAGAIVFDKALNFFGTVFWLYVGLAAMASLPPAGLLGLHTAMGIGVVMLICVGRLRRWAVHLAGKVHRKLGRLAEGVLSAFEEFSLPRKVGFLLYGIVFQLRPLVVCGLLFVAFQADRQPTPQELLGLGSVVVLMSNIPSLGGIGPREAALMAVFAGYTEPATLLSIGLLMSFAVQGFPALLGIPLMFPLIRDLTKHDAWDTGHQAGTGKEDERPVTPRSVREVASAHPEAYISPLSPGGNGANGERAYATPGPPSSDPLSPGE